MKKISCIIPAYNEEAEIENILSIITSLIGECIYEVIVIDDGSSDNTLKILKRFTKIKLIEHKINKGKSRSVAEGIQIALGDYIFLLDADLKYLNKKNIIDLTYPIESNISKISMSYRKNSWPLFPFKGIDYLTGERIFPKHYLVKKISKIAQLPSYGLEVFINKIIINNKLSISIVPWINVENTMIKNGKINFKDIEKTTKIWWNILCTISIFEMYYQNIKMLKLLVK